MRGFDSLDRSIIAIAADRSGVGRTAQSAPALSGAVPDLISSPLMARKTSSGLRSRSGPRFSCRNFRSPATPEAEFETMLCVATHGPNLAAHIDELETIPRQLAECFQIAGQNRRHCAVLRIFDFVTICQIEMSHGITDWLVVFDNVRRVIQAIGRAIHQRLELHKTQRNYFC